MKKILKSLKPMSLKGLTKCLVKVNLLKWLLPNLVLLICYLLSTKRNIFSPINCVKNDEEREGVVFFLDLPEQASRLFNIFGVRLWRESTGEGAKSCREWCWPFIIWQERRGWKSKTEVSISIKSFHPFLWGLWRNGYGLGSSASFRSGS